MDPMAVLSIVTALAKAFEAVAPEVPKVVAALSATDADTLKAALAQIQQLGDETHVATQSKLRGT